MNKVAILLADGFEIIEAMAPVDILKRGGLEVTTISIGNILEVVSSHKIPILADTVISKVDFSQYNLLILPGGYPGYMNLTENPRVQTVIQDFVRENKYIGAICGAASALVSSGILEKNLFTCHSSLKKLVESPNFREENFVRSNNLITSPGAGLSLEFGFQLAKLFLSEEKIKEIKKAMELI